MLRHPAHTLVASFAKQCEHGFSNFPTTEPRQRYTILGATGLWGDLSADIIELLVGLEKETKKKGGKEGMRGSQVGAALENGSICVFFENFSTFFFQLEIAIYRSV